MIFYCILIISILKHTKCEQTAILTYQQGHDKFEINVSKHQNYTIDDIALTISDVLNANNEQLIILYYNNRRVTWRVFSSPRIINPKIPLKKDYLRPYNIKLSDDLLKLYKLDSIKPNKYGIITGQPVDESDLILMT